MFEILTDNINIKAENIIKNIFLNLGKKNKKNKFDIKKYTIEARSPLKSKIKDDMIITKAKI
tara:strand:+ start:290 stop:475 length:186 start_codon:yes stop_codon:yes gene_type:complete